jgi:uncharacterized membrane protein HdeD (DUF308 family)
MTSTTQTPQPFDDASGLAPLHAKRGWNVALGIVYLIAGLIALGSVVMATIVSVFVVGIMMLIAGVAEVFTPFRSRHGAGFYSGFF